jgi:hypothetical protein
MAAIRSPQSITTVICNRIVFSAAGGALRPDRDADAAAAETGV